MQLDAQYLPGTTLEDVLPTFVQCSLPLNNNETPPFSISTLRRSLQHTTRHIHEAVARLFFSHSGLIWEFCPKQDSNLGQSRMAVCED